MVLTLLAKDPGARYASASALVADLDRVAGGLAPEKQTGREAQTELLRPAPAAPVSGGRASRRRLARLLVSLALLALVAVAGWGLLAGPNVGDILGSLEGVPDRIVPPSDVKVPDVEDLDEAAARKRLGEAGLGVVVKKRRSGEEATGQVLEQSVPAGKKVEEGSRILLAISSGPGPGGQQGSAPEPASEDPPRDTGEAGGSGDPPNPEDDGDSGAGSNTASPEPASSAASDAAQGADEAPAATPEPSVREAPAAAQSSPEPASPTPSAPEPSSPGPSSPDPASPAPSSSGPSETRDSSAPPSSPEPSSVEADPTSSPAPADG